MPPAAARRAGRSTPADQLKASEVSRLLAQAPDPDAERAALVARQPHGRLVSAEEVAAAVCYLASPASGSTTGVDLLVDGGLTSLRLPPQAK